MESAYGFVLNRMYTWRNVVKKGRFLQMYFYYKKLIMCILWYFKLLNFSVDLVFFRKILMSKQNKL